MLDYEDIYRQFNTQPNDEQDTSIADDTARSAEALEALQTALKREKEDRIKAETVAKRWQIVSLIISALTLIATVAFGLLTVLN